MGQDGWSSEELEAFLSLVKRFVADAGLVGGRFRLRHREKLK